MELYRFKFEDVDGNGTAVDIFVVIKFPTAITKEEINDAILSYIDSVEDWQYEELIRDVLDSFELVYEIVNPITTILI